MFTKTGSPQPMSIVSDCCVCGKPGSTIKDGKVYCESCVNETINLVDATQI